MRIKPFSERTQSVIVWSLSPLWFPAIMLLVAIIWIDRTASDFFGPTEDWQGWFAWRPVQSHHDYGGSILWLERVERRRQYGQTIYRPLES